MHIAFTVIVAVALGFLALNLYLALFGHDLPYKVGNTPKVPLDSAYFQSLISALTQSELIQGNKVEVLTNGDCFYETELGEIAKAERTIHLEAYIFHKGKIAARYLDALTERARAGVKVRLTLDYIGCFSTFRNYFKQLESAGARIEWYHSLRPDVLLQINNRTHRELLIVDGRVGFIGGAGIADQWYTGEGGKPRWRDTVLRVEGPLVAALQSVFAQNWLRVAGEILSDGDSFRFPRHTEGLAGLVVGSTPAAGATPARILFQLLIASAKKQIYISTPYFLPDRSARRAIVAAVKNRGVAVKILTPGRRSDQMMTRASSRELYGTLLKHGVEIHEYEPAMIHVKAMMVDSCWAVVGSTNFDYRSFDWNDEVNLAILNEEVTRRLARDFERDLAQSTRITYQTWRKKMRYRIADRIFALLERQE
ncbi:MAG: phospholipase D-like domain-containing protein [Acidobacteriota bacterium]|nr:phospholipase D-like domain-containing protein [Acidobacteriota bacterium]